jgi:hypothetical protein
MMEKLSVPFNVKGSMYFLPKFHHMFRFEYSHLYFLSSNLPISNTLTIYNFYETFPATLNASVGWVVIGNTAATY